MHYRLGRDGIASNFKKTQRFYHEDGRTMRRREGFNHGMGARAASSVPTLPNGCWRLDFVDDQIAIGRHPRMPDIGDDVTWERPVAAIDTSTGQSAVRELGDLIVRRGVYGIIISNRTELKLNAVLTWSIEVGIEWQFIKPGKLIQKGLIESFES